MALVNDHWPHETLPETHKKGKIIGLRSFIFLLFYINIYQFFSLLASSSPQLDSFPMKFLSHTYTLYLFMGSDPLEGETPLYCLRFPHTHPPWCSYHSQ